MNADEQREQLLGYALDYLKEVAADTEVPVLDNIAVLVAANSGDLMQVLLTGQQLSDSEKANRNVLNMISVVLSLSVFDLIRSNYTRWDDRYNLVKSLTRCIKARILDMGLAQGYDVATAVQNIINPTGKPS